MTRPTYRHATQSEREGLDGPAMCDRCACRGVDDPANLCALVGEDDCRKFGFWVAVPDVDYPRIVQLCIENPKYDREIAEDLADKIGADPDAVAHVLADLLGYWNNAELDASDAGQSLSEDFLGSFDELCRVRLSKLEGRTVTAPTPHVDPLSPRDADAVQSAESQEIEDALNNLNEEEKE